MNLVLVGALALGAAIVAWIAFRLLGRVSIARAAVLDEVRRTLKGGVVQQTKGRGPQARGRLGQLEITVDLHHDPRRPQQSPMWRVMGVGPVRVERPVEIRLGGWQGWIDPWMEMTETRAVPMRQGPAVDIHTDRPIALDHPVLLAVLRQSEALGPGALHARPDLMRAEVRFVTKADQNRALFAWLQAMAEISDAANGRAAREGESRAMKAARVRVFAPNPE